MISEPSSIYEIAENFSLELKKYNDYVISLFSGTTKLKIQNELEEKTSCLFTITENLFSKYYIDINNSKKEKEENLKNLQNKINDLNEKCIYEKNILQSKKIKYKLNKHKILKIIENKDKEIKDLNENLKSQIQNFDHALKTEIHLRKKMNLWYQRHLKKIEMMIPEKKDPNLSQILYKLKKYQIKLPWIDMPEKDRNFSILSTPFSNYSIISDNQESSKSKTMNKAFYFSEDKQNTSDFIKTAQEKLNDELKLKTKNELDNLFDEDEKKLTVTEKENIVLKLLKTQNGSPNAIHNSVLLDEILNAKTNNNDCSYSFELELLKKKKISKSHNSQNSFEKLLKSQNFTINNMNISKKLSPIFSNKNNLNISQTDLSSKKGSISINNIKKNLNKEIYQNFKNTLDLTCNENYNFSENKENIENNLIENLNFNKEFIDFEEEKIIQSPVFKEKLVKLNIPKLNLEKICNFNNLRDSALSCSPSYRKRAERKNYLNSELSNSQKLSENNLKNKYKKNKINNKITNKSVDFSCENLKSELKTNQNKLVKKIKQKTNNYINNIFPKDYNKINSLFKKHMKNNYSLNENSIINKLEKSKSKKTDFSFLNSKDQEEFENKHIQQESKNPIFMNKKLNYLLNPKNKKIEPLRAVKINNSGSDSENSPQIKQNKKKINEPFLNIVAPTNNINFYIGNNEKKKKGDEKNEFKIENFSIKQIEKENFKNNETIKLLKLGQNNNFSKKNQIPFIKILKERFDFNNESKN